MSKFLETWQATGVWVCLLGLSGLGGCVFFSRFWGEGAMNRFGFEAAEPETPLELPFQVAEESFE